MTIFRGNPFEGEILVCKKCKQPVDKRLGDFYGCGNCNAWVTDVEWIKKAVA